MNPPPSSDSPSKDARSDSFDLELHLQRRAVGLTEEQFDRIRRHPQSGERAFVELLLDNVDPSSARFFGQGEEFVANFNKWIACATIQEIEDLKVETELAEAKETEIPGLQVLWAAYSELSREDLMGILKWNRSDWRWASYQLGKIAGTEQGYALKNAGIRRAIERRYIAAPELQVSVHAKIADYFLQGSDPSCMPNYCRRFVVRHLIKAGNLEKLGELLADLAYLESRVLKGEADELLADYTRALRFLPNEGPFWEKVEGFRRLIAKNYLALASGSASAGQLVSIAYNSCTSGDIRDAAKRSLEIDKKGALEKIQASAPIRSVSRCRTILEPSAETKDHCFYSYEVTVSPDGKTAATFGETNGTIRIWDLDAEVSLRSWKAHESYVASVLFIDEGKKLISFGDDDMIRIWDLETSECLKVLEGHLNTPHHNSVSANTSRLVASSKSETFVWELGPDIRHTTLSDASKSMRCEISPDGKFVIGRTKQGYKAWDAESGNIIRKLDWEGFSVDTNWKNAVVEMPDARICVLDPLTNSIRLTLEVPSDSLVGKPPIGEVRSLDISSDGSIASALFENNTLIVWDVKTGRCLHEWSSEDKCNSVLISNDGGYVALAYFYEHLGSNVPVQVWSVKTGALVLLATHRNFSGFAFDPLGRSLLTTGMDCACRIWELDPKDQYAIIEKAAEVSVLGISKQGKCFVGRQDGSLEVWDASQSLKLNSLKGHTDAISHIEFAPSGRKVATCSDKNLRIWDLGDLKCLLSLDENHFSGEHHMQFTSDSKRLVTGGKNDSSWCVWNTENGKLLLKVKGHGGVFSALKISADDKYLITSSPYMEEEGPKIWDLATGKCLHELNGCESGVMGADGAADFKVVVSAGMEKINLWNGHTGECLKTCDLFKEETIGFCGFGRRVLSITPDARRLLVFHTRNARLWDLETMEPVQLFSGRHTHLDAIGLSPDGKFIVYLDNNGFLRLKSADGASVFEVFLRDSKNFAVDWENGYLAVGYSDGRVEFFKVQMLTPVSITTLR